MGSCSGGMTIGDLVLFRDEAALERLRERSRIRSVMAPKNAREVGEVGADVGDIWPVVSVDFWESTVDVRIGGVGWKFVWSCDDMLATLWLCCSRVCTVE